MPKKYLYKKSVKNFKYLQLIIYILSEWHEKKY